MSDPDISNSTSLSIFSRNCAQSSVVPSNVTLGIPHFNENLYSKKFYKAAIRLTEHTILSLEVVVENFGMTQSTMLESLIFLVIYSSTILFAMLPKSAVNNVPPAIISSYVFPSKLTRRSRSASLLPVT